VGVGSKRVLGMPGETRAMRAGPQCCKDGSTCAVRERHLARLRPKHLDCTKPNVAAFFVSWRLDGGSDGG
jgi:hypothetical protein